MNYPETLYAEIDAAMIDKFIAEAQEETLHLEFKTVRSLFTNQADKKNLVKTLSGFANADGGITVWGVETVPKHQGSPDCASGRSTLIPLSQYVARLNDLTGEAVNPTVDGVQHKRIETGPDEGFAVTLVPSSDAGPHMAKLGDDRYYKRAGSSFTRMEHHDVADMFGRRQRPTVEAVRRLSKNDLNELTPFVSGVLF
jgi:predicted HTH transcriptional regulator